MATTGTTGRHTSLDRWSVGHALRYAAMVLAVAATLTLLVMNVLR